MKLLARFWRCISPVLVVAMVCATLAVPSAPAVAGTTGTISGTITDSATGAPIANAAVSATSPSGNQSSTTDAKGFYVLQNLLPDTYSLSVQATGYESESFPGLTVVQDLAVTQNVHLSTALKTIANVSARSSGSLVRSDTTSDSYTVTGAQLNAISGGNDTHKTLYQYIATIPGITGSGFPAQPRVHGGSAADISYEFDGIPINDEMTGLFTTNLSNVGIGSILVSTGGLNAAQGASGIGVINTVVKSGTYPGFADFTYATTPQYRNIYETAEYGGATRNQKFSWYFSLDSTNALNEYTTGQTYPLVAIEQLNGPGVVKTTDINANFHFRPTDKDDIQFLVQNGLGDFDYGYLMQRAPGEPQPLTINMCNGANAYTTAQLANNQSGVGSAYYNNIGTTTSPVWALNNTYTGGYGGTAPNGQYCPEGIYFGSAATQDAGGNYWHHYSGIGKIQWNHIINDHSSLNLRLSENFNQYIFDQPVADANLAQFQNNPSVDVSATCPLYPYAAGTPVVSGTNYGTVTINGTTYTNAPHDVACMQLANWVSTGFYEDRSSRIWTGQLTYDNTLNANSDIELGIGDDYSPNVYDAFFDGWFNTPGSTASIWPGLNYDTSYPTHTAYAYAQGDFKVHKFLLSPGVRYTSRKYSYPIGGGATGSAVIPTFSFNYAAGSNDVIIGSFSDSSSLVASAYVYRYGPPNMLNGPRTSGLYYCSPQNLSVCGSSPAPTLTHDYNLMWEHQIDANTSIKVGPYYNQATNILTSYVPLYLDTTTSPPTFKPVPATAQGIIGNNGIRKAFGVELGISHNDPRDTGISYWVAATYVNFWTNTNSSLTTPYGTVQLPPSSNVLVRSYLNPPLSGSLTLDVHSHGFHFIPQWYQQSSVTYYYGTPSVSNTGVFTAKALQTPGWGIVNATASLDIGKKRDWTFGVQGSNILNNNRSITPCTASSLASAGLGLGCSSIRPIGIDTSAPGAVAGVSYGSYLNVGQSAPLILFFLTKKL